MGRREFRNEDGLKQKVKVKVDGYFLERAFRNKGDAISYLKRNEDMTNDDIKRRVKFVFGTDADFE